jgi:hypothetical protein
MPSHRARPCDSVTAVVGAPVFALAFGVRFAVRGIEDPLFGCVCAVRIPFVASRSWLQPTQSISQGMAPGTLTGLPQHVFGTVWHPQVQ